MTSGAFTRATTSVASTLVACAVLTTAVGTVGVLGVNRATRAGEELAADELRTATATAVLAHAVDAAYARAQVLRQDDRSGAAQTQSQLLDQDVPQVDAALVTFQRLHAADSAEERASVAATVALWQATRATLIRTRAGSSSSRLPTLYDRLSRRLADLTQREARDAQSDQRRASSVSGRIVRWIVLAVLAGLLVLLGLGVAVIRLIRRAVEPAREQVEFSDTLQLAQDELEAHQLLRRHLERTLVDSDVTVLNRNNSADRLEAATDLPDGSELHRTLAHAEPRSCLAVRSGRVHDEDSRRPALLSCSVCGPCPGNSTCTPLTVSGKVIGSVLVNRRDGYRSEERQQLRDAVFQAAPVLANLRNLAIAEVRAATDSLTGLPNKRAVADTIKRMMAQASRSLAPLSLLVLDLDHFKNLNDRFGHQVGDQALANVGAVLRGALRDGDFAGRNGGEEFAVVLPDTDVAGALVSAERIRAVIADITIPGLDLFLSVSIGVASYPEHAVGAERLERLADSALYTAKRQGRNRVEVASTGTDTKTAVDGGTADGVVPLRTDSPSQALG